MGDCQNDLLRVDFDPQIKLEFHGSTVTSDAGGGVTPVVRGDSGANWAAAAEALERPPDVVQEVQLLKELTWTYVIENPALAAHQRGQRLAIKTLFTAFNEAVVEKHWQLFPTFFRERAESLHSTLQVNGEMPVSRFSGTRIGTSCR